MARYRAQAQPNYVYDNYNIAVWADTKLSVIDDLIHALEQLGIISVTEASELPGKGYDYYFETEKGDVILTFARNSATDNDATYFLSPVPNDGNIFHVKRALSNNQYFDVVDDLRHPFFEPITAIGYVFLTISSIFLGVIALYGRPDFEAQIRGIPLALLVMIGPVVIIANFGGIRFVWKRMSEKFPDPLNLNNLALIYLVILGILTLAMF